MAKKLTKKATKADKPETHLIDANSGSIIRLFEIGNACFGIEATTGTVHTVPKDRVSNLFRRSGYDIHYSDRGFDRAPEDSQAYCTIEELEDICSEVTSDDREAAKAALDESTRKAESGAESKTTRVGELEPPKRD